MISPVSKPTKNDKEVPAYLQIQNYVLDQIKSGVWKEGDLIPTELELCKQFNVSRMTVNRALRELTTDQLLIRIKGSGTYIAQPKYQSTVIEIRNLAQDVRDRGHLHTSHVLLLEKRKVTKAQALRFDLAPNTELFRSLIIHYENDIPIQLEDRLVRAQAAPDYLEQDWSRMTPHEYLMRVCPLPVGHYTIESLLPTEMVAESLKISLQQPCLVMDRATYSNNQFCSHAIMWHPGHRYKFSGRT